MVDFSGGAVQGKLLYFPPRSVSKKRRSIGAQHRNRSNPGVFSEEGYQKWQETRHLMEEDSSGELLRLPS
jgi:hypothetical protein